jgi:hypothetical protein
VATVGAEDSIKRAVGPVIGLVDIQFLGIGHPGPRGQALAPFESNPFREIRKGFASVTRLPLQAHQGPGKENGVLTAARANF